MEEGDPVGDEWGKTEETVDGRRKCSWLEEMPVPDVAWSSVKYTEALVSIKRLTVAIVETELDIRINLIDDPFQVRQLRLLRVSLTPPLKIDALPKSSVHRKVKLDRQFPVWYLVLNASKRLEERALVDGLETALKLPLHERRDDIGRSRQRHLKPDLTRNRTSLLHLLEHRVGLEGDIVVVCLKAHLRELGELHGDFVCGAVRSGLGVHVRVEFGGEVGGLVLEEEPLPDGEGEPRAGLAVWKTLQAAWEGDGEFFKDFLRGGEGDAADEMVALRGTLH